MKLTDEETNHEELKKVAKLDGVERFVVGIVVQYDDSFLVLRRKSDDFMPGLYEIPSGKVEKKETILHALARELQEETGIELTEKPQYISSFDYRSKSGALTRQFNFHIKVPKKPEVVTSEHDAFEWARVPELSKFPISEEVKTLLSSSAPQPHLL